MLGSVVIYRSKTGDYDLAAIVTATSETLSSGGVEAGEVKPLSDRTNVHLQVFTPGKARHYQEFDVPQDDVGATTVQAVIDAGVLPAPTPGTWRWPERVG